MNKHKATQVGARCFLVAQLVGLSVVLSPALQGRAHAAEYLTAVAGGGGGNSFALRCAPDEVLVGIGGRAAAWLDQIGPLCEQVDSFGRWTGNRDGIGSAGGTGGSAFQLLCAGNQAVSGIQGRASSFIDQLRIRCEPLTAGPRLAASGSVLGGQAGGSGGTVFGPFDCADNKPGRGLIGRASAYVDQVQLVCDYPPSPLTSIGAQMLDSETRTLTSLVRARGETFLRIILSSEPYARADVYVPVKSNNPGIAVAQYDSLHPGEVRLQGFIPGNYLGTMVLPRGVGCATFEAGFPGHVAPPVTVLVDSVPVPQLALSLSTLAWDARTGAFGTFTIPAPAPAGGVSLRLTSSHPALAIVPSSVVIPAGSRSTTFEIRRSNMRTVGACVIVSATGNGASVQGTMLFPFEGMMKGVPR